MTMALQIVEARPFVKWAGGKARLCLEYAKLGLFPKKFNRYFEPFVGGGAVFMYLRPENSILSDSNPELINAYRVVKNHVEGLIDLLREHQRAHNEDYYYRVRRQNPALMGIVERAARLVYLNKTCYNGLYRVNSKGRFNVPFGDYKNPAILDEENLRAVSELLQPVELRVGDFRDCLKDCRRGDFVYLDPPYQPISRTSSFTGYTKGSFGEEMQGTLAETFRDLERSGCLVLESNSHATLLHRLYSDCYITEVKAPRFINCKGNQRGKITEYAITNYPV